VRALVGSPVRVLAANIKVAFPAWVLKGVVALLLIANILNIASDLAAMGKSPSLSAALIGI